MLKDAVRTDAYRDYIYNNKHLFAGKVVLDVGCGTGILSLFCARAGAAHVYAVDNSPIITKAKLIAAENGYEDKITFLHGRVEDLIRITPLVNAKVDFIISEWMGMMQPGSNHRILFVV
jgi:protein arginine N-methyltransferase 3